MFCISCVVKVLFVLFIELGVYKLFMLRFISDGVLGIICIKLSWVVSILLSFLIDIFVVIEIINFLEKLIVCSGLYILVISCGLIVNIIIFVCCVVVRLLLVV